MSNTIKTVLVANRGEIAVRVLQGAARLGYHTVAVYSDADANARHVRVADRAVRIGPPAAAESYLSINAIIDAARTSGADAIHPGYGFLSESAEFAQAVEDAGLVFVGPPAEAIRLMGNKRAAKERMEAAAVPCIPGYRSAAGANESAEALAEQAKKIGLPVMVKAAAGGGGRGMRLVDDADELVEAIGSARSEAKSAFGNDELILEKAVTGARHVEIQILADNHGNAVYLGERDCSVQRRHQKVVEECPCPVADASLRQAMGEAAVAAAQAIDYRSAGTVEFLLDGDGRFYFLEMNTRLQVEHPVTELVTGIDLVAGQLRIAAGERVGLSQDGIHMHGHAIEVRLCAEEPANEFMPQSGHILAWQPPTGEGVRVDHGVLDGGQISPFYDSMQAKIIAWGEDRETARRRLLQALDDTVFLGVPSNRDFLRRILAHDAFASGDFDTGFVPTHFPEVAAVLPEPDSRHIALAAALLVQGDTEVLGRAGVGAELLSWRSSNVVPIPMSLRVGREQEKHQITVIFEAPGRYRVASAAADDGDDQVVEIARDGEHRLRWTVGVDSGRATQVREGETLWLDAFGITARYQDVTLAATETRGSTEGSGELKARSDGKIVEVRVAPGETVEAGQTILTLEAMKMEFQITAEIDGTVAEVCVAAGDQVAARTLLARIEAPEEG